MTKVSYDIDKTIAEVERLLDTDKSTSPALRASVTMLIMVIRILTDRVNLNSRNSSKPPSSDPNREKKPRAKSNKLAGGQHGHNATTLSKVDDPDEINTLNIDRRTLPKGNYTEAGFESRQLFDCAPRQTRQGSDG